MPRFLLLLALLFSMPVFSQGNLSLNAEQDTTIQLKNILIEKGIKKPKIKKIKIGKHIMTHYSFFSDDQFYYLTDSIPDGYLQQITLFFSEQAIKPKIGVRDYSTFKVHKTEFEITFYEVGDGCSLGSKVNIDPIPITLEESTNDRLKKIELNLAQYDFETSRFFICLKRITKIDASEIDTYYHAPVLYDTRDNYHYITDKTNEVYKKQKQICDSCFGLRMDIKTLTRDY